MKKYYVNLDILRIILCISILLYHLNIIYGGYLAVCSFFVLSGYLAVRSAFSYDKFNILKYYYNRLKKIYLPLLITVFITILITSFIKEINWINIKPETKSVLLGYNNFWQLDSNLDYFAHNVLSPFTHLWYMAILIQFEIVFPFIFIIFKYIGKHVHKILPYLLSIILAIISYYYFFDLTSINVMNAYYHTLSRIYALFIGVSLGFIHYYYKPLIAPYLKNKKACNTIFYLYIIFIIILFLSIKVSSTIYPYFMLIICLITCRLIDYGISVQGDKKYLISALANSSYEVYLVQYPLIFIFTFYTFNQNIKNIIIIILTFILALIIHFALNLRKKALRPLRYLLFIIIIILTINGAIIYNKTNDHTKELKRLETTLAQNEKIMSEKQKEYEYNKQKEDEYWQSILANLDTEEENIKQMVKELSIVGVGDSVMLGAINELYEMFPNGYFDAKVSRTDYEANGILINLNNNNMLGNPVVFNLGTNGQCGSRCREEILATCGDRRIYWVNVTNDYEVHVNDDLKAFADSHDNVTLIDWNSVSTGHSEYFMADGIHLTPEGRNVYTNTIYETIYQDYIKEFNTKKEELLKQKENALKEEITFYGNSLLINSYKELVKNYDKANYIINESFDYTLLNNEIDKAISNNNLTYNIVFVFDKKFKITDKQLDELLNKLDNYNVYIIMLNKNIDINKNNIHIIDFKKEIKNHSDYLMIDQIHLTNKGNTALVNTIKINVNVK